MRNIDLIREVTTAAEGRWPYVLAGLSIDVPDSSRRHAPCPACGGKDRFRFDDNGRGSFICNQCGAGDGLDLIKRVNNCDTTEAAQLAADVLGIDYRAAESAPDAASQRQRQLAADRQQREQERQKQAAEDADQRRATFARLYTGMRLRSIQGESEYLQSKGLTGFKYPLMPDGSLLLELVDESGAVTAAQTITPQGEKRLIKGSAKRGAYYAVNALERPQSVVIAEGLATALTCHLIRTDALTVAAIDAGNLLPVAEVMRRKYPQAQIIIAADNDHQQGGPESGGTNTGKDAAEKAALSVAGWVSLPPTECKADWNDYHQQHGLETATAAFNDSMYQPKGEDVKPQLQAIEGGKKRRSAEAGDISQMAASQKAKLLSSRWEMLAVNPDSGSVYCYGSGVWEKVADSELERVMVSIFEEHEAHYTEKGIKSVVATMKLQLPVIGEQRGDLIGFENGVYDLTAQTFSPHSPDNWLVNHNGIAYMPPAPGENLATHAPSFTRWLNHATAGNNQKAERIKAALFMVLAKRHDWQLFIEVTGEGGSGKSVFSSIATTLAGEHNTASGSMSTLDLARGRAQFVGKSLIIMPDQTRYVGEGAGIKAVTGGDPVEIDGKYEKQFTTVLSAVVLATNNEPMTFTERNGGIARRRVIFPFNNPVSEADKDPDLTAKIRSEIPVIIRHLLATFADQNKAKTLLIEQRDSQEALDVKRGTDPVIDMCAALYFMNEPKGLMMGGGSWAGQPEPRAYLYHLYLAFLEYHGLGKPLSVEKFSRAMKNSAKEYRSQYLTRKVRGRTQTNLSITELAEEFIPRAYGADIPETP
ncbi:primase-helicase zinc-binding domain-containing protein [Klebsiella pneumoniae]|uniref:primase-helicase zinc-binding domain-containing protein n=1 Tax=Klebsiella TaxID=570 RepID=UPI0010A675A8|nr:primase-helicase zinc-binding domain-containing protein [Klebsiella pneumoniae]EKZ6481011.1 toprim domain-containing protein [Klebsiella pneumoniae]EKZ6488020.1 toprim domain-containing protein [Klebsiella pneumoniae]MBK5716700.1 toprim domain-containing protein [Klebsiella pneumoniae]MBK5738973.1 toprim domain-containing protein [Klebsiella pneumoniae]MBK5801541.1 toprim domain-containing protein [Klebsiella pneumoniae]